MFEAFAEKSLAQVKGRGTETCYLVEHDGRLGLREMHWSLGNQIMWFDKAEFLKLLRAGLEYFEIEKKLVDEVLAKYE